MSRTGIDGDQVQDETLTTDDIQNDTIEIEDLSTQTLTDLETAAAFDPGSTPLTSTTIGDAIRETITITSAAASPGFSFGRSGNLSQNTWLRRPGNVPSNRAGVTINITNPVITKVACANRNNETFDVEIWEHEGNSVNLTLLGTVSIVNATSESFDVSFPATNGKQLPVRLGATSSTNVRDLGVDLTLQGTQ